MKPFFPNSNSFGVLSHSKGFGQNSFRTLYGSLGQIRLGLPKGSAEISTKVPRKVPPRFSPRFRQGFTKVSPRFHQGSTKLLQISWRLWFSGADPPWAAKRVLLGLPKSSVEGSSRFHRGSTKVPSRFHQGSAKVPPRSHAAEWSLV